MRLVMNDPGDRFFYRGDVRGLQLRLYRPGEEAKITPRWDFEAGFAADGKLPDGPKWTLLDGDLVLAVGGLENQGFNVWDGWAYAAPLTPRQWLFAAWCAQACMAWVKRAHSSRIRATAFTPRAGRLLRRIGYRPSQMFPNVFVEAA